MDGLWGRDVLLKEEIRAAVRKRREALDPEWVEEASRAAQDRVMRLPEFADAAVIGCYMATAAEVLTGALLERCHGEGKTVCVPARRPDAAGYGLAVLREDAELTAGWMGIEEPAEKDWISVTGVDCIVVPGLGFDSAGGRVGYGGGNYDRILAPVAGNAACFKIGLAFGFQLFDRVPLADGDILMDAVITEQETLRVTAQDNGQGG
jgi:5-formyltetrahydrofolate cyclo-ligase